MPLLAGGTGRARARAVESGPGWGGLRSTVARVRRDFFPRPVPIERWDGGAYFALTLASAVYGPIVKSVRSVGITSLMVVR